MKKWRAIITGLIVLILIYFIIPGTTTIKETLDIDKSSQALYRNMKDFGNWKKWWPEATAQNEIKLPFNNSQYVLNDKAFNSFFIDIINKGTVIKSGLVLTELNKDSTQLEWAAQIPASINPITRLQNYFKSKTIRADIRSLLLKMQSFYSGTLNTYGIEIKREFVKDSLLIATHDSTAGYPSVEKIYSLLNTLRNYATSEQATITDSPMLNIYSKDNKVFYTRVAYPLNKKLQSKDKIEYKWMLKGGNILTTEVKGGEGSLKKALHTMEEYMNDYNLKSPAIPFYSLISNRLIQKDSTKWITKIYYPVMYYN